MNELKNIIFIKLSKWKYILRFFLNRVKIRSIGEKKYAEEWFEKVTGKKPNLEDPRTLNEKIVWLKLNYYEDFHTKACDKYLIHQYLEEKLGEDLAPKLYFVTHDPDELTPENIKRYPCIIKVSNGSGSNLIVKSKEQYSNRYISEYFKEQIVFANEHVFISMEHQYLPKDPYIVVEELLRDEKGGLPNDYKFLYINGELQFIYCTVDRLGENIRQVYDKNWIRLHFIWVSHADKSIFDRYEATSDIPVPKNFERMLMISKRIAEDFPLVRVDFYETGEKIYIGEITLHHGSGGDIFYPGMFDLIYGEKLILPEIKRKDQTP